MKTSEASAFRLMSSAQSTDRYPGYLRFLTGAIALRLIKTTVPLPGVKGLRETR